MKYVILLFAFSMALYACNSADPSEESTSEETIAIDSNLCECHELTFDEAYNHFYRFERRKGYFGRCEEFYPDGSLQLEKHFEDGKVHGKMISYHENGQIWEDQEFDMNFQVGEKIIYTKSGQVKFHALYKRGQQIEVLVAKPWLELDD